MAAWRIVVRALHAHGPATAGQLELTLEGAIPCRSALTRALDMGLVASPGHSGRHLQGIWTLTPLGVDWCEGRVCQAPAPFKPGSKGRPKIQFAATWLASLPRDIRITAETLPILWV